MWKDFVGVAIKPEEFPAYVAGLGTLRWFPEGVTFHNTAAPRLDQWQEMGPAHDARIRNLQAFYEGRGWHAGPHLFVSRNYINVFTSLTVPGVHSRCYNKTHFGIEMVGDYETEEFDSGDGALVKRNAALAAAVLLAKIGAKTSAITFHRDCAADEHACPGKNVNRAHLVGLVSDEIFKLAAAPKRAGTPAPVLQPLPIGVAAFQKKLRELGYAPGPVDGVEGVMTKGALIAYAKAKLEEEIKNG